MILLKTNQNKMESISMPVLLTEPSTKAERAMFFQILRKAVVAFGDNKSVRCLRIVSDDTDTLNEAALELETF